MKNHIIPYFEEKNILLKDLKAYHLDEYYKLKINASHINQSNKILSATSVKHHHQQISKALSDAQRKGYVEMNAASLAKTPKAEKYKASFLESEEVSKLLTLVKKTSIEIPVTLCAIYGLRRSEVLGLRWTNIDFNKGYIHISETLQQNTGGNYVDKTKTESSNRTLPLTDSVRTLLTNHKSMQEKTALAMGDFYTNSDYVCTFVDGNIISPNYLSKKFNQLISKSSVAKIRLHDLRHSVASNLFANGFSVVEVQEWLGHANASTTLDIYTHAMKDSKQKSANKLDEMFTL